MRRPLPFRKVNRRDGAQYDPSLQRHHLLPCQLLTMRCFTPFFDAVGRERIGFDDFRRNGMLLPAREEAVGRLLLPLHRGPHRDYNAMVADRVGRIERAWARDRVRFGTDNHEAAAMRLALLQKGLRRRLLDCRQPLMLNRKDPLGAGVDFSSLDALAEELWAAA
ncbi:AHH domain-containing protein [Qipengyuania soli]|uniref:AHH domain-containing protein n=1 Tax=Qipengyuania soli TaxID=2782568 RepID=A0A7S8IWD2_9SPHN|nr:AHH domain-containing protein [Qipengyuania soli]QPC99871.1 AHH domain-containing protein [Qipengyuania soli]